MPSAALVVVVKDARGHGNAEFVAWNDHDLATKSVKQLAAELGVTPSAVSRARTRRGIPPARLGHGGSPETALRKAQEASLLAGQAIPATLEEARKNAKARGNKALSRRRANSAARKRMAERGTVGNVYFVRAGEFVKIGWSENVQRRFDQIQSHCPLECVLLGVIAERTEYDEHRLHDRFASLRVRGEWFRFTDEIAAAVPGVPRKL